MAGHHPTPLTLDPAYVKYNNMWINRYKYFRWTGRTAKITFAYMVVVPSIIGYIAYTSDVRSSSIIGPVAKETKGKYDMRGKRRGDTIYER
ncbi:NADHubiquinone oxidoreductase 6.6kD subunit [Golovinomyces cichoracearum]|uniref:NADHubiquinone oxidoreductase 6.6kD subunit n=1 Tax=Golovinomyces cichoracearum TaxID=62708 RepID=A0A420HDG7_9PEZI|nr:NADHubiquinone oxidoreductase 6.6kD subunit [Golovinomyces cichoracearum]RKF57903.1 NADHubiquinone oxidoreductase 6.6kD subunit [Golovinomyces cichoracearum]RKF77562.1 NADHubiquinone oxidoreductase 6.6kD subunit [Golovinomyces cichoracearum]